MKTMLKQAGNFVMIIIAFPLYVLYRIGVAFMGAERVFPGWSQLVSLMPGTSGVYLRRAFYRMVLPQCGDDAWISFAVIFSHPTARIGKHVYIGPFCMIGDVSLEEDALIGAHVSIMNGNRQHSIDRLDVPVREQPGEFPRVTVGRDTWIGDRSVVMADVGPHSVVGAASVVTKTVAPFEIVVGSPARAVGSRARQQDPESAISNPVITASGDSHTDTHRTDVGLNANRV